MIYRQDFTSPEIHFSAPKFQDPSHLLEMLRITTGLFLNNVELWGGGSMFVLVDPIYPVTPSTMLSICYAAGSRLVLEKTGVNKMFPLPSNNLQALGKEESWGGWGVGRQEVWKKLGPMLRCIDVSYLKHTSQSFSRLSHT